MHDFKKLEVWEKSMKLAEDVYAMTQKFQDNEKYGLISQMRRCAVSIPSNIAERAGRNGDKEFANYLAISPGSAFELETQLLLSARLELVEEKIVKTFLLS
ncbi:MAG: four helix bundle protein [Cyclobacteriaceae bacterium]